MDVNSLKSVSPITSFESYSVLIQHVEHKKKKVKQIHLSIFLALFLLVFELKNEKFQEKILERSIFVL